MTDLLFQMGLSNACLSLVLAIAAMVVGARIRRPDLAHLLWLLVFVKLVTPPIVTVPIVTIPAQGETAVATDDHSSPGLLTSDGSELNIEASKGPRLKRTVWNHARVWLPPVWLLGSVVAFAWSMVRICRFGRLLARRSDVAPQELQTSAAKTARRLGLKTIPIIRTTSARISPMAWWTGGEVRIVIPETLLDQMDAQQSQWILAHEMAHVRRRDYLVRWLEWLACVCFWWNPVVWWAQRNLRAAEEICCDELVMSRLSPKPESCANSLLSAVEFLARPALRPPAMASEINGGGSLERRFKMIVSKKTNRLNSYWLKVCVLLFAVVVLPLGIASAQDYEAVEKRLGEAVSKGELSLEQAGVMMAALRKSPDAKKALTKKSPDAKKAPTKKAPIKKSPDVKKAPTKKASEPKKVPIKKVPGAKKQTVKIKSDTDLGGAWEKLAAMVKAGELTKEQAIDKMSAIKKDAAKKGKGSERAKAYLMKVKKELGDAVEAGRISKEEAARKFAAAEKGIKERMAASSKSGPKLLTRKEYELAEAKLKKAVAEGKMSKEDMRARLDGMRREMAGQKERSERRITIDEYKRAEAKMRKMIEDGRAKPEDVERRLIEMRKMIARSGEAGAVEAVDWEGIKRRIEGAVKSGKMTREEAGAKYKAIRERMAGRTE